MIPNPPDHHDHADIDSVAFPDAREADAAETRGSVAGAFGEDVFNQGAEDRTKVLNEEGLAKLKSGGRGFNILREENPGWIPDFRNAQLTDLDLNRVDLAGVDLTGACLRNVRLYQARLSGSVLSNAKIFSSNMSFADLSNADLTGVYLEDVNMSYAKLCRANLTGATMRGNVDLEGTNFSRANMRDVKLFCYTQFNITPGRFADAACLDISPESGPYILGIFEEAKRIAAELLSREDKARLEEEGLEKLVSGDVPGFNDLRARHKRWEADLGTGVLLAGVNLMGVNLSMARLCGADLSDANLSGADLRGINLTGAKLDGANLSGAQLTGARLEGADFACADLSSVNFAMAELKKANLSGAVMCGAVGAHAKLFDADLTAVNMTNAIMVGASFWGASLERARLVGANLSEAVFYEADLSGANFRGADLSKADLSKVKGVTAEQLAMASSLDGAFAHGRGKASSIIEEARRIKKSRQN